MPRSRSHGCILHYSCSPRLHVAAERGQGLPTLHMSMLLTYFFKRNDMLLPIALALERIKTLAHSDIALSKYAADFSYHLGALICLPQFFSSCTHKDTRRLRQLRCVSWYKSQSHTHIFSIPFLAHLCLRKSFCRHIALVF